MNYLHLYEFNWLIAISIPPMLSVCSSNAVPACTAFGP